jgi:hypothetical protein
VEKEEMKTMKRYFISVGATLAALLMTAACSRPTAVLDNDRMVAILVDVHKAEGILEVQADQYPSDSAMEWLVQSVLDKHGVTKADYDSSLVWYSTHLREFIRVYNKVRVQVAAEQDSLKALLNMEVTSPAGDTAELWRETPYALLDPAHYTGGRVYTVASDSNFRASDSLAFGFRLMNVPKNSHAIATLSLVYDKDSMMTETQVIAAAQHVTLGLRADSTLKLNEVLTSLYIIPSDTGKVTPVVVDSLSLKRFH